ncbi:MAG: DUF438 domain-containing protein [Methanomassiliicoccus sp.]|nr:DUF438 domain-containing protein [Methanomassiliicoccus sp.]
MDRQFIVTGPPLRERVLEIIASLREGKAEKDVMEALEGTDPFLIESAEEELLQGGVTRDDLLLLCDARSELFTWAEEIDETILERPGHPVHTLMEEHRQILLFMTGVRDMARELRSGIVPKGGRKVTIDEVEPFIREAQKHFQMEENVLFPYMEKHGVEGPPAAMWSEHEVLRANERELISLIARQRFMDREEFLADLECRSSILLSLLNAHFHKENHVLFPMAIRLLDVHEWNDARRQFQDIGPCNFVESHAPLEFETVEVRPTSPAEAIILPTGSFTVEQLEMVLSALPMDFSYVDEEDRLRFYSGSPERIFVRAPASIGRKVQNCHPQKSVQAVQRIIDDFRAGKRSDAEFWLEAQGRFVHIRYFPLWDKAGRYKGVLEVVQDVTGIRQLEGEKRLLDQE